MKKHPLNTYLHVYYFSVWNLKKSNKDIITMVFFAIYTNTGQFTHKACRPWDKLPPVKGKSTALHYV